MTIRERLSNGWHDGIHLPSSPERGCTSRGGKLGCEGSSSTLKAQPEAQASQVHSQPAAGGHHLHISLCPWAPSSILFSFWHNLHTHFLLPSSQQRPSFCALAGGHHLPFFFPFSFPGNCCLSAPGRHLPTLL